MHITLSNPVAQNFMYIYISHLFFFFGQSGEYIENNKQQLQTGHRGQISGNTPVIIQPIHISIKQNT